MYNYMHIYIYNYMHIYIYITYNYMHIYIYIHILFFGDKILLSASSSWCAILSF